MPHSRRANYLHLHQGDKTLTQGRHIDHRDKNEPAIRATLHALQVTTYPIKGPAGVPDLLCVAQGRIFLVEVKIDDKGRLSTDQKIFRDTMHHFNVGYYVVFDADGARDAVRLELTR